MKKRISILCILFLAVLIALILPVHGAPPSIPCRAAVLMDARTGQVLWDKSMHLRSAPASTTKILTAILAMESGRLDEEVTVSVRAAATPGSSMHLSAGQKISLRELALGLLLRSGNDAAVAIAEHLAGSVDSFVVRMNEKAQHIGATHSHFQNPHGLSAANHYSTAYDLAWITRYALNNRLFSDVVATKEINIDWLDRRGREHNQYLRNTNRLLWLLEEADGVKTGTTGEAGPCLVSSATRGNQKLIAVVLHDHSRWQSSLKLLQYGFDTFRLYEYGQAGDVAGVLAVDNGDTGELDAILDDQAELVVRTEDLPHVTVEMNLPDRLTAPVYQGQKIGEVVFYIHDKAVKTVDIVAGSAAAERTPVRIFFEHLLQLFRLLSTWDLI